MHCLKSNNFRISVDELQLISWDFFCTQIISEIKKIYKLGTKIDGGLEYTIINSPKKVFDLDNVLIELKSSK